MTHPEHTCVLCVHLRPNSKPRLYDNAQACTTCRLRLAAIPGQIDDARDWLLDIHEPQRGKTQHRTPVAAGIPMAIDPFDLTANRWPPRSATGRARLSVNMGDQIGYLPIKVQLAGWVDDWAGIRGKGESLPDDTWSVHTLSVWLATRTPWACDEHPAVDEYATEMLNLRSALFRIVGKPEPDDRPTQIKGQPCPRCRYLTLWRHPDGDTECQHEDCGTIWRPDEYERVTKAVARHAQRATR